ncbi:MAG TPA: hypothetical protein VFQ61_39010 [Polyangiaceae bacterium]|nr:hypothetical protein [Polyangiaceae bacterium]
MSTSVTHCSNLPHSFHIPVMGIGFTLDTPVAVAPLGLSSVISLVDDVLLEEVRAHFLRERGEPYVAITDEDPDPRAHRVTAYLNLIDRMARERFEWLRGSTFEDPKGIRRYFELLPEGPDRQAYLQFLATPEGPERRQLEAELRARVVMGSIDVNIMTKLDRQLDNRGLERPAGQSDAVAALRGFAESTLAGNVVLSAGMNPRMFAIFAQYADFFPQGGMPPKKGVIIKVSDFRSAAVQGRFLARRGVWPKEFRIESGLNCGGHAFPTDGVLLGPILEEFRTGRDQLAEELFSVYKKSKENPAAATSPMPALRVTVQGGIGTASEDRLLRTRFGMDGTGWASPFLLVREVSRTSEDCLARLTNPQTAKVVLTWGSPLGVPFWSLENSGSDRARRERIRAGRPGSACPKGFLALHAGLAKVPLCAASRAYQKIKLAEVDPAEPAREAVMARITEPQCICHDLGGGIRQTFGIDPAATPSICPGPNIRFFTREYSLDEMVGHIYGRLDLLEGVRRPHQFIQELALYVDFLRDRLAEIGTPLNDKKVQDYESYRQHLSEGIAFYDRLVPDLPAAERAAFREGLREQEARLDSLRRVCPVSSEAAPMQASG